MYWIDSQSKKLIHLKHLILELTYTFFSIFSWYFKFYARWTLYHLCFQALTTTTFVFCLKDIKKCFIVFIFTALKKKIFIFESF